MMVTLMRDGRDRCAGRKFLGNRSASESGRPRVHNLVVAARCEHDRLDQGSPPYAHRTNMRNPG